VKTIKALNTKIEPFLREQVDPEKMPTYRDIIKIQLNSHKPANNSESLEIGTVLGKLKLPDVDIQFENAEFHLIMRLFNENQAALVSGWHTPVVTHLKKCELESGS